MSEWSDSWFHTFHSERPKRCKQMQMWRPPNSLKCSSFLPPRKGENPIRDIPFHHCHGVLRSLFLPICCISFIHQIAKTGLDLWTLRNRVSQGRILRFFVSSEKWGQSLCTANGIPHFRMKAKKCKRCNWGVAGSSSLIHYWLFNFHSKQSVTSKSLRRRMTLPCGTKS